MPSSSGELILPNLVPDSELSLDGRVVFRDGQTLVQAAWMSSGEIHLALGDGRHFLVVRQACP
jgi:hypothetical protein